MDIRVIFGSDEHVFRGVENGITLANFKMAYLSTLGIPQDAALHVNGKITVGTYALNNNDTVEARKETGTKG